VLFQILDAVDLEAQAIPISKSGQQRIARLPCA
jgi:hypothetical protein